MQTIADVGDRVILVSESVDGKHPHNLHFTAEFNRIFNAEGRHTVERLVSFPLADGASWDSDFHPGVKRDVDFTARVVGREPCPCKAGTFDAYKIEASGRWSDTTALDGQQGGAGRVWQFYWYAPEVKRIVRRTYQWWFNRNILAEDIWDLVQYSPAK